MEWNRKASGSSWFGENKWDRSILKTTTKEIPFFSLSLAFSHLFQHHNFSHYFTLAQSSENPFLKLNSLNELRVLDSPFLTRDRLDLIVRRLVANIKVSPHGLMRRRSSPFEGIKSKREDTSKASPDRLFEMLSYLKSEYARPENL